MKECDRIVIIADSRKQDRSHKKTSFKTPSKVFETISEKSFEISQVIFIKRRERLKRINFKSL